VAADDSKDELLNFIGADAIVQAIDSWAEDHHDEFLSAIGGAFDADGQLAVGAAAGAVKSVELVGDKLIADVTFGITYRNRVDDEDTEMSAENITDQTLTVELEAPVVHTFEFHDLTVKPDSAH